MIDTLMFAGGLIGSIAGMFLVGYMIGHEAGVRKQRALRRTEKMRSRCW